MASTFIPLNISNPIRDRAVLSSHTRRMRTGRSEPGVAPVVAGFTADSAALETDRLAPGDRICSINGIATARLTNDEVLRLLDNVEERASLEVEYYMPDYASQNSLYVTTKLAEVPLEKINGSLGITIRGGVPEAAADLVLDSRALAAPPLVVTHVRAGGAAYRTSRIKPGDRLLKVDHRTIPADGAVVLRYFDLAHVRCRSYESLDKISLTNKTLSEVHQILQTCPQVTSLTIEYDISVMESVKLATGPLLVEIERPCNEDLGLFLSNQRYSDDCYSSGSDTYQRVGACHAIFIDSILPASISDSIVVSASMLLKFETRARGRARPGQLLVGQWFVVRALLRGLPKLRALAGKE
ncbi:Glutamate receptor-interacting protein 1 [Eumeta japonica]|uniref:Glutamate receptor-interacting protein 1 n=1 Tax=Eumeta variegata TaxID=151549 RepID=A0A4C1XUA9_EUMVA|nr:Glutamate receptor-interacting protein 1 [Eumeta japonica]